MWRKGLALLMLVALAVNVLMPASVWAESPYVTNNSTNNGSPLDNNPDAGQDEGLIAKIIAKLFETINTAMATMGFASVEQLIYNISEAKLQFQGGGIDPKYLSATGPNFGLYSDSEWKHVKTFYGIAFALAWLAIVYQLILVGVGIAKPTNDPAKRRSIQEAFGSLITTGIFVTVSWVPVAFFLEVNNAFVNMLSQPIRRSGPIGTAVMTDSTLVGALVNFFFILAMIVLNIQYLLRKFAITVLFVIAPLIACLWLSKSRRATLFLWLAELASHVFLQSAHALVFLLFWTLYFAGKSSGSIFGVWWAPIVMIFALTPLANLVRKLITSLFGVRYQNTEEKEAMSLGMSGFGQMATMAVAGIGALGRGIGSLSSYVRSFFPSGPSGGGGHGGGSPAPEVVNAAGVTGVSGGMEGVNQQGQRFMQTGGIPRFVAYSGRTQMPLVDSSASGGQVAQLAAAAGGSSGVAGDTSMVSMPAAGPAGIVPPAGLPDSAQNRAEHQALAAARGVGRLSPSTLHQVASNWAKRGYALGGAIGNAAGKAMASTLAHVVPNMHVSRATLSGIGRLGQMVGGAAGAALFAAAGTAGHLGSVAVRRLSSVGSSDQSGGRATNVIPFPARTQPSVGIERPLTRIQGGKVRANRFGAPFNGNR